MKSKINRIIFTCILIALLISCNNGIYTPEKNESHQTDNNVDQDESYYTTENNILKEAFSQIEYKTSFDDDKGKLQIVLTNYDILKSNNDQNVIVSGTITIKGNATNSYFDDSSEEPQVQVADCDINAILYITNSINTNINGKYEYYINTLDLSKEKLVLNGTEINAEEYRELLYNKIIEPSMNVFNNPYSDNCIPYIIVETDIRNITGTVYQKIKYTDYGMTGITDINFIFSGHEIIAHFSFNITDIIEVELLSITYDSEILSLPMVDQHVQEMAIATVQNGLSMFQMN